MHSEPKNKSESAIQQELVKWYRNTYCLKHHNPRCMILSVPNEGRGSKSAQLIGTGLYAGAADLCIIHWIPKVCAYRTIFIEVKRPEGIQSPKQKSFEAHARSMGVGYHISRGLDEFKGVIEAL